ncbi:MAG: hypothetical protein PHG00_16375 [Methylococcales bacterium]|nr:hypothetical protein [Methylococcales bacterium]
MFELDSQYVRILIYDTNFLNKLISCKAYHLVPTHRIRLLQANFEPPPVKVAQSKSAASPLCSIQLQPCNAPVVRADNRPQRRDLLILPGLHTEDQGYAITIIRIPDASSQPRVTAVYKPEFQVKIDLQFRLLKFTFLYAYSFLIRNNFFFKFIEVTVVLLML